jgi:hypothetical protein
MSSRIGWLRLNPMKRVAKLTYIDPCCGDPQSMFSRPGLRKFHELGEPVYATQTQSFQNGLRAPRNACSRVIPTSFNIRTSSAFRSCHPCRRASHISITLTQCNSIGRSIGRRMPARDLESLDCTTNDSDILSSVLMAKRQRGRRASLVKLEMPWQQSINSLPCPRFSHEGP